MEISKTAEKIRQALEESFVLSLEGIAVEARRLYRLGELHSSLGQSAEHYAQQIVHLQRRSLALEEGHRQTMAQPDALLVRQVVGHT